jgi:hypothetical protein
MLICILAFVFVQPPAKAPLVGRPNDGFYGAIGEKVRLEMSIAPDEVEVEKPLILGLKILGADNFEMIERPDLRRIPEFATRFHIDDLPDPSAAGARVFLYSLRPKNEQVHAVPPLLFRYFNPKLKYYAATAPQEELKLVVKPRAPTEGGAPMQEPEFLYEALNESELLRRPDEEQPRFIWLAVALLVPIVVFEIWFLFWRRIRPDEAKLAQLRRSRAVRTALDALKLLVNVPQPELTDRVVGIVKTYMHDRFGLAVQTETPDEIVAELTRLNLPPTRIERARAFFRLCDAARFGPPDKDRDSLTTAAEQFVLILESAI